MSFVSACWRLCYCTVEVLTGTSHLLYIKRTLRGFKCYLFACSVLMKVDDHQFIQGLQLFESLAWQVISTFGRIQPSWIRQSTETGRLLVKYSFYVLSAADAQSSLRLIIHGFFFHILVCWHGCKTILIQLTSVIFFFFFSSSYDRVFIMVPKGFKCLKTST